VNAAAPLRRLRARLAGRPIGLAGVLAVLLLGIFGVVWGSRSDPPTRVELFDAGPVDGFAIGRVAPFPERNVYVVGLADGRLRAIDGIVKASGCAVAWLPADERGRARNVGGEPGVYADACSGGTWYATGDALPPTAEPLRTFHLNYRAATDGTHLWIELLGDRGGRP
jgi:hypothetical protein